MIVSCGRKKLRIKLICRNLDVKREARCRKIGNIKEIAYMTKYTEDEKKLIKELKTQKEKQQYNNR